MEPSGSPTEARQSGASGAGPIDAGLWCGNSRGKGTAPKAVIAGRAGVAGWLRPGSGPMNTSEANKATLQLSKSGSWNFVAGIEAKTVKERTFESTWSRDARNFSSGFL